MNNGTGFDDSDDFRSRLIGAGIIIFVIVAIIMVVIGVAAHSSGSASQRRTDRVEQENHPKIKYKYVTHSHVIKKHIPVVHVENATAKDEAQVAKKTHQADLAAIKKVDQKYANSSRDKITAQELKQLQKNLEESQKQAKAQDKVKKSTKIIKHGRK